MNEFDQRWKTAACAARRTPDAISTLPFGFSTRILAQFQGIETEPWLELVTTLGLRAVVTSAALFVASTVLAMWQVEFLPLVPSWFDSTLSPRLLLP